MNLGLRNRPAVVLASSSGLGFGVAKALAAEGAKVAISGRDAERLNRAAGELASIADGASVFARNLDVTNGNALRTYLDAAADALGPIEILVINAGGPPAGSAVDTTLDDLDRAYELTLKSAVVAVEHVLGGMRERKWGRIIAMTSQSVRHPIPGLALSNTMRPALTGWLKTLSREVAADGVLVNTICTGLFDTERLDELFEVRAKMSGRTVDEERQLAADSLPVKRIGNTNEFGAMVAFMASDSAARSSRETCGAVASQKMRPSTWSMI